MSFSEIKLYPVTKTGSVIKANGSFVYNGTVRISCSVVLGKNGLFVSLPREKYTDKEGNEKWADKVFFTDETVRKELNESVVAAYQKQTGGDLSQGKSPEPSTQAKRKSNVPF
jgi:DNA-binding cell septation regulator SpoVG